jgi:gas vesicle protein
MRRKLVLWGSNEKDEKILVALELLEKENVVNIYTFPENVATEDFYKSLSEKWKDDEEVEFPAGFTKVERKLSVSDSLLPDEIKVERTDLINRAQAEWHFVVLSSKLYGLYKSELEELKEKVEGLGEYDNVLWNDLRDFWGKVQNQVNDKNLFREHGAALREKTNHLFDKLKGLKKSLESEFETQSKKYVTDFSNELSEIEDKIEKGLGLSPLFEDLKKVQAKIKDFRFTKDDRNELWDKIDATFKKLKDKRGQGGNGQHSSGNNNLDRLESRQKGLLGAIHKMQQSIDFDQKDLDFQTKKVADSDGQLESQLRAAKIRMIEERLKSKQEKLDDMNLTRAEIESKIEKEKKRAVKVEKQEKLDEAKEVVKQKIAVGIAEQTKEMDKISDKLEKAATELVKPKKEGSFMDKIAASVEQLVEDVVDTAKAVAEVASDKLEDLMDKAEDLADKAEDKLEDLADRAEDKFEDIKDKAEDKFDDLKEDASEFADKAGDKFDELKDQASEKFQDFKEQADVLADKAGDKFDGLKDGASDLADKAEDKFEALKDKVVANFSESKDDAEDLAENVEDKADGIEKSEGDSDASIADKKDEVV